MTRTQKNRYFDKRFGVVLRLVFATLIFASAAFGHAKMLRSEPSNGEKLGQTPKAVVLTFSERLQATEMNSIVVTDSNGRRVDKNILLFTPDGKIITAGLEEIGAGVYTVDWKALSADDHLMKGSFSFTVTGSKIAETPVASPAPASTPELTADAETVNENRTNSEKEAPPALEGSGTNPLQSFVRWLTYLAMMTLFGGFAFLLLVVKPAFSGLEISDHEKAQVLLEAEKRIVWINSLSILTIISAAVLNLILQTAIVMETSLVEAAKPTNLYRVLKGTAFGTPWLLQVAAALSMIVPIVVMNRRNRRSAEPKNQARGGNVAIVAGLIISAMMLGTLSLTGHARAAQSEYRFAVLSDWLHLLAAGIWVGGIFQFVLTLPKADANLPDFSRLAFLSRLIARFSGLAILATGLLLATGIYNSWIHLKGARDLITTPYGITLLLKIILFLLMLPLGGFNRYYIRPRIGKLLGAGQAAGGIRATRDFYFVIRLETAFAAAILLLAAILAFLPHSQGHHVGANGDQEIMKRNFARRGFADSRNDDALPAAALQNTGTIEK